MPDNQNFASRLQAAVAGAKTVETGLVDAAVAYVPPMEGVGLCVDSSSS